MTYDQKHDATCFSPKPEEYRKDERDRFGITQTEVDLEYTSLQSGSFWCVQTFRGACHVYERPSHVYELLMDGRGELCGVFRAPDGATALDQYRRFRTAVNNSGVHFIKLGLEE
jgi:hypothetical protein